jgi:hypothetical protein
MAMAEPANKFFLLSNAGIDFHAQSMEPYAVNK